jgi:uridine kinase
MKTNAMEPFVIGLTGLSGSGKTFYVNRLKEELGDSLCIVGFDDYYKPLQEQAVDEHGEANYDLPSALYADRFYQDLLKLIEYKPIVIKKYQFEHYDAPEVMETIMPAPVILVEGLFVMEIKPVDQLLNYRIFVDCDTDLCFERRLARDIRERNIPRERSLHQWDYHVMPAYKKFIEPHKEGCQLVIENIGSPEANIQTILNHIHAHAHPSVIQSLMK